MSKVCVGGVLPNSLCNGTGTRFVIFFEGCIHQCLECQNEHLWEMKPEDFIDTEELCRQIEEQIPMITGITLSGGDPFMQSNEATVVAKFAHSLGLDVWTYTGYTYEELESMSETNADYNKLLKETDTLVDGRYEESLYVDSLRYMGSSNQRIINLIGGKRNG